MTAVDLLGIVAFVAMTTLALVLGLRYAAAKVKRRAPNDDDDGVC